MFRVAFSFSSPKAVVVHYFGEPCGGGYVPGLWRVTKCYDLRHGADYAQPVRIDRDHGRARQRLVVLSPVRVEAGSYVTPYEALRAYLLALDPAIKEARAADMRFCDPAHGAPYTERVA